MNESYRISKIEQIEMTTWSWRDWRRDASCTTCSYCRAAGRGAKVSAGGALAVAAPPADTLAPLPAALQYEQVVQEASLRQSRQLQVVISNLEAFPAESPDSIQADTEMFLREEMQVAEADSKVLAVKRLLGTDGRLGPIIITVSSTAQHISILQPGKHLKGRSIWVNPDWTKMQAQEQFRLRQQRRETISHGFKAYFKSGKLVVDRSQTAASPSASPAPLQAGRTASPNQPPATTPAAAAAVSSQQ